MPSGLQRKIARRGLRRLTLALCALAIMLAPALRADAAEVVFPEPSAIQPNVNFWVQVFSRYSERDFIIHDRDDIQRVYEVMHLPGTGDPTREEVAYVNDYLKNKYSSILNRLAAGEKPVTYEDIRVANMFKGEPPAAFALAAQNLRVQQGLRDRFREGLLRSRYYRPTMERIFRAAGLPPELVTLATVESGFYSRAKSSAGAVGIWQFTRGTGRQYMRITRWHDDRLNPETETRAAAELLRSNYDSLGSWPLAITAYNYGTGGTEMAASQFGGDYNKIVREYNGPHFGFAARNYYAEFLAALYIHENEDRIFPDLKYDEAPPPPPVRTDFAPPHRSHRWRRWGVHRVSAHHSASLRHHHHTVARATRARRVHAAAHQSKQRVASAHSSHPRGRHVRLANRGSRHRKDS